MFYKIINIRKDKFKTVDNRFLTFRIGELKIEDTDILTFNLESIVFNCLKEVIVYVK